MQGLVWFGFGECYPSLLPISPHFGMGPGMAWDDLRLLMEEVKFEKGDDQKKVDTMVKRVIQMFMEAGCFFGSDESDVTIWPQKVDGLVVIFSNKMLKIR